MIYASLFAMFFRIGLFSFGGGLAMLPLIFQSVQDFGMMTAAEFSDLVALSQVTPGPIAVNAATYVGFNGAGIPGALAATLGVSLPSFILILIVVKFLERFQESKGIQGAFLDPSGNGRSDRIGSSFRRRNGAGQWTDHFNKTVYGRDKLF